MEIKLLKVGDLIYQKLDVDVDLLEDTDEIKKILTNLNTLKQTTLDTINWWLGDKITKSSGNIFKLSAANSKAIVLLVKLLETLNPDTSKLTDTEKTIYDNLTALANDGYADSDLLLNTISDLKSYLEKGEELIKEATAATTVDELIAVLNKLD